MNILIVSQYFHPETFVINEIAYDLVALGHAVTVLTGIPNYPSGNLFDGYSARSRGETHRGVTIVRVPMITRGAGKGLRLMANYASYALMASLWGPRVARRGSFDAILAFEVSPVTVGIPAMALRRLTGAPMFFWVEDLWPETLAAIDATQSPVVLGAVRRLVRAIYRASDVILVQSRAFEPRVRDVAGRDVDIRYLPNPADRSFRPIEASPEAPELSLLRPGFRIVYAGNIGAAQDFGTLLGAAELLKARKDIQWTIIGNGRMRPWVEEEITRRGLGETVAVIGAFPPERMPAFFAHADVLFASLGKQDIFALTMPQKLQSYLACGKPIIAAIDGEAARVVNEAGAGIATPAGDAAAVAEAVLRLYAAPRSEREAMGQSGRKYFEREFDRDLLVRRLEGWMQELAETRRRTLAQRPVVSR